MKTTNIGSEVPKGPGTGPLDDGGNGPLGGGGNGPLGGRARGITGEIARELRVLAKLFDELAKEMPRFIAKKLK